MALQGVIDGEKDGKGDLPGMKGASTTQKTIIDPDKPVGAVGLSQITFPAILTIRLCLDIALRGSLVRLLG